MSKRYKKIAPNYIPPGPIVLKPYFKELRISESRLRFKIAAKMTQRVASNFKNDAKFRQAGWLCVGCPPLILPAASPTQLLPPSLPHIDTEEHIILCDGYSDLREGLDLQTDRDLVTYFRQVIERRLSNEEKNNI